MALDFSFSAEHLAVREMAARFAKQEMLPLVREAEESETFPRELFKKWGVSAAAPVAAAAPAAAAGGAAAKLKNEKKFSIHHKI